MKNGMYSEDSRNEKVTILLPPLQISCMVTPIEDFISIVFTYRLVGEKKAITTMPVPDDTYLLTKRSAQAFSDKLGFHLDGGNTVVEDEMLVKCAVIGEEMLSDVLSLASDIAKELGFKFKATSMPGMVTFGKTALQTVSMSLSQFTVE